MNTEFPRLLCLLRKENNLTQEQLAKKLSLSQTTLSYYENGSRDCCLPVLIKIADFFGVSTDYLLGRTPIRSMADVKANEIPDNQNTQTEKAAIISFNKKLVVNSVDVLYSLISECENAVLVKEASGYLMLSVYKMFRQLYSSNDRNNQNFFSVDKELSQSLASSAMSVCEAKVNATTKRNDCCVAVSTVGLMKDYPDYYASVLKLVQVSEAKMKIISSAEF